MIPVGITEVIISTLSALGTGLATFLFTRAKYKSEVKHQDLLNVGLTLELYKKVIEDCQSEQSRAKEMRELLQTQITTLQQENLELRKENHTLQCLLQDCNLRLQKLEALLLTKRRKSHGTKKTVQDK